MRPYSKVGKPNKSSEKHKGISRDFRKNTLQTVRRSDRDKPKQLTEAVAQRCSVKKVLLEISQNSQENDCVKSLFFNKAAGEEKLIQSCKNLAV